MKRHAALARLSREHHLALALSKRAKSILGETNKAPLRLAFEMAKSFDQDIEPHFRIEERILLPALEKQGQLTLAARTFNEHNALRELASRLMIGETGEIQVFGALLEQHVRFEERELFPLIEATLTQAMLEEIQQEIDSANQNVMDPRI